MSPLRAWAKVRVSCARTVSSMVFVATVAFATGASAQAVPEPTLPRDQPPDTTATTPEQATSTDQAASTDQQVSGSQAGAGFSVPARWEYLLGFGGGYDSNIDFRVANGPSSWAISPQGWLGRAFTGRRSRLRLGGGGVWYGYPDEPVFNRFNVNAGLAGDYRPSPDTTWQARGSYSLGYSDQSSVLSEQGVLIPLVRTRTAVADLGVVQALGRNTSLRLGGYFSRVDFDQNGLATAGLTTGQNVRGTAALRRTFARRDSLAVEYSLGFTLARQPLGPISGNASSYYLTHFGWLQWEHVLSRRSALLLEGGASYTPESQQALLPRQWSFYGGGTYDLRVRRADLMLYARRQVTPAFGLGVSRIQNSFGMRAVVPMGRAWTFRVTATHSIPEAPANSAFTYGTYDDVFGGLSRRLGRHLSLWSGGRYLRRGATGIFPEVDSYQVTMFLSVADETGAGSGRIGSPTGTSF